MPIEVQCVQRLQSFVFKQAPQETTTYVYAQLAMTTNQSTTYTMTLVETALGLNANQAATDTITDVDTTLGLKANQATAYAIAQAATTVELKANRAYNLHADRGRCITSCNNYILIFRVGASSACDRIHHLHHAST